MLTDFVYYQVFKTLIHPTICQGRYVLENQPLDFFKLETIVSHPYHVILTHNLSAFYVGCNSDPVTIVVLYTT